MQHKCLFFTKKHNISVIILFTWKMNRIMKYTEFKKWLQKQGAVFTPHKSGSSHFKVTLNGKTTVFPFHGGKEIGTGLVQKIKRDLGL